MNFRTLVIRSLAFRFRSHLGVLLGAAIGSAALTGALVVGDSVRESLHSMALARLGKVEAALDGGDRLFRSQLATEIKSGDALGGDAEVAAVLKLAGIAASADGSARANKVQVLGVDAEFWKLAQRPPPFQSVSNDTVVLNASLAHQLRAAIGSTIVLRVEKPGVLSRDATISPQNDLAVAMRLTVAAIAGDAEFGRFGLQASQVPPFNAFVSLPQLQRAVAQTDRANLMLFAGKADEPADISLISINKSLEDRWSLEDGELYVRDLTNNMGTELRSSRIFLEPSVVDAATKIFPNSTQVLTYMVNEISSSDGAIPYSMVTASDAPYVPASMKSNEILLNDWATEDLKVRDGDKVKIRYFAMSAGRGLEEKEAEFRVAGSVSIKGPFGDRTLMPDFPGIAEAESSSDWDGGFPIDMKKIRPKDEQYWKLYRGTPKGFIPLETGQLLWSNRFGNVTAIRISKSSGSTADVTAYLRQLIGPKMFGQSFEPVREQALNASAQAQDFGGLFIGFSFFLIAAALILMGLLFAFSVEQRMVETGTLLALGFRPRQVRRMYMAEGLLIVALGGVFGIIGGILYADLMLMGLTSLWRDAVGTSSLQFYVKPESLIFGAAGTVLMAVVPIWWTLRRQGRQPVRELLAGIIPERGIYAASKAKANRGGEISTISNPSRPSGLKAALRRSHGFWITPLAAICAAWTMYEACSAPEADRADTFFSAGCLWLIAGLGLAAIWLSRAGVSKRMSTGALALLGCGRRRQRSLATIGLLSCGVFLIVAIGAFRMDAGQSAALRSSGTGGFALIAESAFPVTQDLNTREGREFFGINSNVLDHTRVLAFRVHAGDEASCLNLNRAQKPRLIGVNPAWLAEQKCFTFTERDPNYATNTANPWEMLNAISSADSVTTNLSVDAVPAIADANSIEWALGKKIGDTIDYTDASGKTFKVKLVGALANSVLQGSLVIGESEFIKRFPDESGHRLFLIDAPAENSAAVSAELTRAMRDAGLEVRSTVARLNEFNAVQNTYLNTFQVLGGLGLLIGSAGLGVVVLRNVQERRGELALLLAVGFQRREVETIVLMEHAALLCAGLFVGSVAALVAVFPSVASAAQFPWLSLGLTQLAVLLNGFAWTWLASRLALRGRLVESLRSE